VTAREAEAGQPGLGARLRATRRERGCTQAALAGDDLSVSYISLLEAGRREPTAGTLQLLADRLQTTVEYLLSGVDPAERASHELELRFAELALANGDADEARRRFTALSGLAGTSDEQVAWRVRRGLAAAAEAVGDLGAAIAEFEQLRESAERSPQVLPWLGVVVDLSRCYREAGDLQRAIDVAEHALTRVTDAQLASVGVPQLTATLAAAYRARGDLHRAGYLLDKILREDSPSSSRRDRGGAFWNASVLAAERGHPKDALVLADRALALFSEDVDERSLCRLKVMKAWVLLSQQPPESQAALDLLLSVLPELAATGSAVDLAYAETELARAQLLEGAATAPGGGRAPRGGGGPTTGDWRPRTRASPSRAASALWVRTTPRTSSCARRPWCSRPVPPTGRPPPPGGRSPSSTSRAGGPTRRPPAWPARSMDSGSWAASRSPRCRPERAHRSRPR
jgi:transcriptional regulator with XRE-family HTH domain